MKTEVISSLLLKIIICPICKSKVYMKDKKIICKNCKKEYPIRNGIPIMAKDGLTRDERDNLLYFDKLYSSKELLEKTRSNLIEIYEESIVERFFYKILDKEVKDKKYVLDLGCGAGCIGTRIIEDIEHLFSLDISYQSLMYAKNKINSDEVDFIQGNLNRLPFESNYFDMVVCNFTLHHIKNLENAIKEISRVLKKGGIFLCFEPLKRKTWFEFWIETIKVPENLSKKLKNFYFETTQKKPSKKDNVISELKDFGEKLEFKGHFHRSLYEYKEIFRKSSMDVSIKSVCTEIFPPRLLFNKNKFISKTFLNFSDLFIKISNLSEKGNFVIIQYYKSI